jgi:serine/threonine protein kinase
MTTTTAHTGTARYLAYELIASDEEPRPTTASDVHALGCVGMEVRTAPSLWYLFRRSFLQFIYSQPPYSHVQTLHHRAHFKICQEISNRVPPATRPPNINSAISELWDILESCWKLEPEDRPATEVICDYLYERGEEIMNSLE